MEFWNACVLSPVSSTAISAWDLSYQTLAGNPSSFGSGSRNSSSGTSALGCRIFSSSAGWICSVALEV